MVGGCERLYDCNSSSQARTNWCKLPPTIEILAVKSGHSLSIALPASHVPPVMHLLRIIFDTQLLTHVCRTPCATATTGYGGPNPSQLCTLFEEAV
jgi:hypothetical protein